MSASASRTRTARREQRRQQLVDATIACIARTGMSAMTLADVARQAGLSGGIVNLHFDSKENLLHETLRYLADEYLTLFDRTLDAANGSAADKLLELMRLDIRPSVCNQKKVAVWFAFWGESKARPAYRKICDERDRYYDDAVASLCADIIADGAYEGIDAESVAEGLSALTNGLWLSYLISPRSWDRQQAMDSISTFLAALFPRHFQRGLPA